MPRLLALIPEDGWAMLADGASIVFVRPPFRSAERVAVSETMLADAVAVHGYTAQVGSPEESWAEVIARVRDLMARARTPGTLPTSGELLLRMLRSGPPSVVTNLLTTIENVWLAQGEFRAAQRALKALLGEERVKNDPALRDRALALRDRLDDLRDERASRVPTPSIPSRIAATAVKVHRVVLLIVDDDDLGVAGVTNVIENVRYPNHCLAPKVMRVETREVNWTDDHPLNSGSTCEAAFEELFKS